ncbi:MAG: transposase [Muribaculum sp.]|nr:transposase [Muribaculum sp.]
MNNKQYRKTPRASFIDYDAGYFFITICTKNRFHYFGEIENAEMHLSNLGMFLYNQLFIANEINKCIEVLLFVVMPNHLHAIIYVKPNSLNFSLNSPIQQRSPNPSLRANSTCQRHVPTLSRYVNSLKGSVTKYAKSLSLQFEWQSRYHDHAIRNLNEMNRISEYIMNNVSNWKQDCFYE